MKVMHDLLDEMNSVLASILDDASLAKVALDDQQRLRLWLIDPAYQIENLPAGAAQRVMDNPLYWMFCWASGRVMAQQILDNPDLVKNRVVMDVGSGSGVVAIAAALSGAERVIASDIDPMSQNAIRLNRDLNAVDQKRFDVIGDYRDYSGQVDLITVADVLYDRDNLPLLDALLDHAADMMLADSRVKNFTHPRLVKTAKFPGETFPALGGFDEFSEVNFYRKSC
ncbi:Ribosomal protein L11 methyltransferase [BD1-7 clade bacterium]|uniref:Ribosomal protein L11 methyltransferase n=1 Tax=BD1-7 clade bacterium TaxID=2029982 RepID=A0A5S9PVB5_9GAMM|nr:Ribosomal protein L11 methyltransferase [BD1-7 clade bacterium]